jgi:hypothetical protein
MTQIFSWFISALAWLAHMGNSGSNSRNEGRPTSSGGFTPLTPSRRPGNILVTTTHQPQAQTPPLSPTVESPDATVASLTPSKSNEDPKADSGGHPDKDSEKGGGERNMDGQAYERLSESEDPFVAETDTSQDKGESRKFRNCRHRDCFWSLFVREPWKTFFWSTKTSIWNVKNRFIEI